MASTFTTRLGLAAILAAVAVAGSGCRYFKSERRVEMQPFAENTVTAIGEMRKIQAQPVWIRLRPYFNDPSILETRAMAKPLMDLVRGVNAYSLQVVSLNESRISDRSKSRELAKFLHSASQQALLNEADEAEIKLTADRRDAVLKDIESKETFMAALQAAEPIVNAVLARGLDLSDQVDASIMKSANVIEAQVQAEYKPMLANRAALLQQQERTIQATAWAEAIGYGDTAAVESLRKAVPVLAEHLPAGRAPTAKDQEAIVAFLSGQALRLKAALDQIEPQYQAYRESVLELDQLRAKAVDNAKLARSVLMVWSRSHKNLARGVEVPPMFDLAKIITSTTSSAAKGVLPF